MSVDAVFDQAMSLSEVEREDLIRRLLPTLPASDVDPGVVAAAWHSEILARLDRFDRGQTTAVPTAEVFDRLERKFGDGGT
jgi:putative addiction module component (TIGR02574 family)